MNPQEEKELEAVMADIERERKNEPKIPIANLINIRDFLLSHISVDHWDEATSIIDQELVSAWESIKEERKKIKDTGENPLPQPISLSSLLKKEIPDLQWIINGLIPTNGITILSSPPGFYKTWVLLEIVLRIILKQKVFGQFEPIKEDIGVLVVNEENWEGMMQMRIKNLLNDEDSEKLSAGPPNLYFYNEAGIQLDSETINQLIDFCQKKNIKFLILDSLSSVNNFDENSSTEIKKLFDELKRFKRAGISLLLTHHHRKESIFRPTNPSENMRGSTNILAQLDSHLIITKKKIENDEFIIFYQGKSRLQHETEPFKVDIASDEDSMKFIYNGRFTTDDERKSIIEKYRGPVAEFISQNSGCAIENVVDAFKGTVGGKNIREIVKALLNEHLLYAEGKRPKKYYLLSTSEEVLSGSTAEEPEVGQEELLT